MGDWAAMLPMFVVNLDRSPERLALMTQRCQEIGISFERFPAVDGTDIPEALRRYFSDASGRIVSPLRPAEIGCYASHLGVWQHIVDENLPAAVVCEDDADLPGSFRAIVREIVSELAAGWDMVKLSAKPDHAMRPLLPLSSHPSSIVRYSRVPGGTTCYLISRAGALKMLQPHAPRMWAADQDTRWPWKFGMNIFGVYPRPVGVGNAISTINPGGRRAGGRSGLRRGWQMTPTRSIEGFLFNVNQLGPYWWARCAVVNVGVKLYKMLRPIVRQAKRIAARDHPERA
jgi:glycosyl transferase, family 25